MKLSSLFLACSILTPLVAPGADLAGVTNAVSVTNQPLPQPTAWAVTNRDANSKTYQRTVYRQTPRGPQPKIQSYQALGNGMHFKRDGQGDWLETVERFELLPDGSAAATNGPHQLFAPADIYTGVIRAVGEDGRQQQMRPWGLAFFDGTNSVLLSEITNSIGLLSPSGNEILWTNCFTEGVEASIRLKYRKSGFECDLVLNSRLPEPGMFEGLNPDPAACRLQLLSEFFSTDDPEIHAGARSQNGELADSTILAFGSMHMVRGSAFLIGGSQTNSLGRKSAVPVFKSWQKFNDNGTARTFLCEETPWARIKPKLDELAALDQSPGTGVRDVLGPQRSTSRSGTQTAATRATLRRASPSRLLASSQRPTRQSSNSSIQLAKSDQMHRPGLLWDYTELTGSVTNFTCLGNEVYLVDSWFYVTHDLTLMGGTCLKFPEDLDGCVEVGGQIICKTAPYSPAIFTSVNDDISEPLPGSTGTPSLGVTWPNYLMLDGNTNALRYLRFSYAGNALFMANAPAEFWDTQFLHCGECINLWANQPGRLHNVLFSDVEAAVFDDSGSPTVVRAEHVTADQCYQFVISASPSAYVTNSILTALGTALPSPGTNGPGVVLLPSGAGVYQRNASGGYYLADDTYRNIGSTNLSAQMLQRLRETSTYPPIIISNVTISEDLTLSAQAPRDTLLPSLGYHYSGPFDFLVTGCGIQAAKLTIEPGVAIGVSGGSDGFAVLDGSALNCLGTFEQPIIIASADCVQEQSVWPYCAAVGTGSDSGVNGLGGTFRFTRFCGMGNTFSHFYGDSSYYASMTFVFRDCEFYNGVFANAGASLYTTNCLFERASLSLQDSSSQELIFMNNLFRDGTFTVAYSSSEPWTFQNNAFDNYQFNNLNYNYAASTYGYNAFSRVLYLYSDYDYSYFGIGGPDPTDVLGDITWVTGPAGNIYQQTNSPLVNAGSTTADALGLYHYTIVTNLVSGLEIREQNTVVDLGYHAVALNSAGLAIDDDHDGIVSYLEDTNGNGISTDDLSSWLISDAPGGVTLGSGLVVFTPLH
jgi:hypothetical protein